MKTLWKCMLACAIAAIMSACEKTDTSQPPEISLRLLSQTENSAKFLIVTSYAEECAYLNLPAGGFIPSTAEEIMKNGTRLPVEKEIEFEVEAESNVKYAIIAAVSNKSGNAVSEKIEYVIDGSSVNPPDDPQGEGIDETFSSAQVVYQQDGTIIFNLLESPNYGKLSVQINGLENGALQGNSHLLADGTYQTIAPAYLLDMEGNGDIDNPLEKGASVTIGKSGSDRDITVMGKLSDGRNVKGRFTGGFEAVGSEFELKGYSLSGISLDMSGPGKWTENPGGGYTLEVPLGSNSDFDKVSQLSIQFVLEEQALPEGEYKIGMAGGNGTVKLAKVYLDETRWVWPLEYKEGNISVTHDGEKYRFMLEFRESFDSNYKKYAGVEVIYGGSFSAEFNGTIQYVGTEPGEGPVDPGPEIITEQVDYSLGSTPPEAEYGYSAEMGGYYGKIYFARPTPADINTCIYFLNHAENAAETLDPEAGGIEFLPGMSYISFGEGDNEDGEYYRLTEGGIDMSYDSSSGEWTFNFNGIMTNTVTGIQWKIITKYTGPIDGFSSVKPE